MKPTILLVRTQGSNSSLVFKLLKMIQLKFALLLFASLMGSVKMEYVHFKRSSTTTKFLYDVTIFKATSRIECGTLCNAILNDDDCTAFALDEMNGDCVCGKKRFAPVEFPPSYFDVIHVKMTCKKAQTGL